MWSSELQDRAAIAWLLAPHSVDEFLQEYYEKKPLHIARNAPGYYNRYFSLSEMERVLYGTGLRTHDLHVFKEGVQVRTETYTEPSKNKLPDGNEEPSDVIDPDRASALFASGCTINLVGVHRFSPSAMALNREMEMLFRCAINPNVYLTPAGNQGFSVHYDTHDTLIVQIEGSKLWRLYGSPVELPLDEQRFNSKVMSPGDLQMEFQMQPGDLLYIPRGYCHEAKANEGLSLHVTFGLFPPRWCQVLAETILQAAENDVRLRRIAGFGEALEAAIALVPEILSSHRVAEMLETVQAKFVSTRRNQLDGQLHQIAGLKDLNEKSIVCKRPNVLYKVIEGEENTKLCFSGKTIILAKGAAAIIHELEALSNVPVSALLKHDPKAVNIVKRMIQEGFALQAVPEPALDFSVA